MENYTWKIGSFATGDIIDMPLYVVGEPEIDTTVSNEDTATIKILMTPYSDTIRNSWATYFKEVLHFCVAVGESSGDVLWAGMINKITPSIAEQTLEFQLVNPSEYTSARIVGETFGEVVEDPTAGVEIEGANYSEIIAGLVRRCFAPIARANTPQPPNILLEALPAKTGDAKKMTFLYSDMISYSEAIENVIEESGLDIETRYSAYWDNEAKTRVKWQFVAGSDSAPHINELQTISIQLRDAENIRKVSEFESLVDSTELFNSFYISSKSGDEEAKNGMDLKNAVAYDNDFPILLETYYSPGVELSEAQLNSQLSSYISQGMNTKRTGAVAIELESEDFILWAHSYLGRIITFTGYDNTLSAGHSVSLRIVGVRFDLSSGRVLIDLMSKQPRYPKLPRKKGAKSKKKTDQKKISPSNRLVKAKDVAKFKGGGGLPPTPPWEGGGAYPPSDAGPGGQWGTGSETIKDDNSPYAVNSYGTQFMDIDEFQLRLYIETYGLQPVCCCQNLSNVFLTWAIKADKGAYYWDTSVPVQNMNNAFTTSSLTTPRPNNFTDFGSGYFDNGGLLGYQNNRFSMSIDPILNSVLSDPNSWGFSFSDSYPSNPIYSFAGIVSMRYSEGGIFTIRDEVFYCLNVELTPFYRNSSNSTVQGTQVTKSVFFTRKLESWDNLGSPVPRKNGTINGSSISASRVGDWGMIKNSTGYHVNNFSQIELMNPWNWYNIPVPPSINSTTMSRVEPPVIGKVIINDSGLTQNYLIETGDDNSNHKIFGLKMLGGNQPLPIEGAVWEDISNLFPVPTTFTSNRSIRIDSLSGYLITRIGGSVSSSSGDRIFEEIYMQNDNGVWKKLAGVDQLVGNIERIHFSSRIRSYTNIYQFNDWVYYTPGEGTSTSGGLNSNPKAFQLKKVPDWALPDPTDP